MYSNSNRSSFSHLTTLSAFCDKCLPSLGRHRYLPGGGSLGQQQRQPQHIRTTATAVAALTALIAAATVPGATGSKWCGGSRTSDRTAAGKFVQKGNVQTGCRDFCTHWYFMDSTDYLYSGLSGSELGICFFRTNRSAIQDEFLVARFVQCS